MDGTKIKDVEEAQAIAREFTQEHGLRNNDALSVARDWFNGGNQGDWRETLTVENLNAKLASAFLVRKD